jgi:hypothetical protein
MPRGILIAATSAGDIISGVEGRDCIPTPPRFPAAPGDFLPAGLNNEIHPHTDNPIIATATAITGRILLRLFMSPRSRNG